jgi:hypothetical protein
MVHSSALTVATDGEHLTCNCFSLSKTILFGSIEFIVDCFGGLSLFPKGVTQVLSLWAQPIAVHYCYRAITKDSTDDFYMASSGEGSSGLPTFWRHNTGTLPAPIATTPWPEDTLATWIMMKVPPRTLAPRLGTGLPPKRWHCFQEGQRA